MSKLAYILSMLNTKEFLKGNVRNFESSETLRQLQKGMKFIKSLGPFGEFIIHSFIQKVSFLTKSSA